MRPLDALKKPEGPPLTITVKEVVVMQDFIHERHLGPEPNLFSNVQEETP